MATVSSIHTFNKSHRWVAFVVLRNGRHLNRPVGNRSMGYSLPCNRRRFHSRLSLHGRTSNGDCVHINNDLPRRFQAVYSYHPNSVILSAAPERKRWGGVEGPRCGSHHHYHPHYFNLNAKTTSAPSPRMVRAVEVMPSPSGSFDFVSRDEATRDSAQDESTRNRARRPSLIMNA